jgi:hypothetical protein
MRFTRRRVLVGLASGVLAASGLAAAISVAPSASAGTANPFGPSVTIFDPSMPVDQINAALNAPGTGPREFLFAPGTYGSAAGQDDPSTATGIINAKVTDNTLIAGLGASPDDVVINGALYVPGNGFGSLAISGRSLMNLTINPIEPGLPAHTMNWVTSQTAVWRRVHLEGSVDITTIPGGVFAFGNVIANSRIDGTINDTDAQNTAAGPGLQSNGIYYVRNSRIGGFNGFSLLMEFSGVKGAPKDDFGPATATQGPGDDVTLPSTPVSREAPFLYLDHGQYYVFVPKARTSTSGYDWAVNPSAGKSVPLSSFYIAQPADTAGTLNAKLAQGSNLLLTPGNYSLNQALTVNRPDAVVMGMGFAKATATSGTAALEVGNVPGVILSGFSVTGTGPVIADHEVQIGTPGASSGSRSDPTTLNDVSIWSGAVTAEIINQDHVLADQAEVITGDGGGSGVWTDPVGSYGIVVNGDHVTWEGLWVEHFKKTQMTWNGEDGQVVFLENEPPYTPPSQAAWMDGAKDGYRSLKINDNVDHFTLNGFITATRFSNGCNCYTASAIETPVSRHVTFHGVIAMSVLFPVPPGTTASGFTVGGYHHVFNDIGPAVDAGVASGTSKLPYSDVFGITATLRIDTFPSDSLLKASRH